MRTATTLLTAFAALACGPAAVDAPDNPDSDYIDEHDHGTGSTSAHIHGIEFWGETQLVAMATHEGVYRIDDDGTELIHVGGTGDFMGFEHDPFNPQRYWGSGHFPQGQLPNWGFIESVDGGATWSEVSLSGEVDFHQMAVGWDRGGVVAGTWSGLLYFSDDAGRTWEDWRLPGSPTGLEIEDASGPTFLVASDTGIRRVSAPSMDAIPIVEEPVTALDRFDDGFVYATASGIHFCGSSLNDCETRPSPTTAMVTRVLVHPRHLDRVYVLTASSDVYHSDDGAQSWEQVVDGS